MPVFSLVLSLCRVHGRERPVWSCGVVEWFGRPPNEQPVAWSDSWSQSSGIPGNRHEPFWTLLEQRIAHALHINQFTCGQPVVLLFAPQNNIAYRARERGPDRLQAKISQSHGGLWNWAIHSVGRTLRSFPRKRFHLWEPYERSALQALKCSLLLPWQSSPAGKVRSEAVNPVISTPCWLNLSEIPKPSHCWWARRWRLLDIICLHSLPRLATFRQPVLILAEEISSSFMPPIQTLCSLIQFASG